MKGMILSDLSSWWAFPPSFTTILAGLCLALFLVSIIWKKGFSSTARSSSSATAAASDEKLGGAVGLDGNSVAGVDTKYLASRLGPESTHMDILLAIATTPENISLTQQMLDKIDDMRREIIQKRNNKASSSKHKSNSNNSKGNSKSNNSTGFVLGDSGWADDDDDDEATRKAKEEDALREKEKQQLAEATGAADPPMEGLDEGVLGQLWVERTLERFGQWPLSDAKLRFLSGQTFTYQGKQLSALDHPAVRRNLCFTMGRLNSVVLNTHAELCMLCACCCCCYGCLDPIGTHLILALFSLSYLLAYETRIGTHTSPPTTTMTQPQNISGSQFQETHRSNLLQIQYGLPPTSRSLIGGITSNCGYYEFLSVGQNNH